MPTPVAVVDVLQGLLDAEQNSISRFMGEGSPYLSRATGEVRQPLEAMVHTSEARARALARLIDELGGVPLGPGVNAEEQYLAYLSVRFLLPKLVQDKELCLERYCNAQKAIGVGPKKAVDLIARCITEVAAELQTLQQAAEKAGSTR